MKLIIKHKQLNNINLLGIQPTEYYLISINS